MANRGQVKRSIKQLQHVKTWQLIILLMLCVFVAATFLRLNNIGMVQRRNAVLAADKAGDPNAIKGRLFELQRYVTAHMNADMSTIYLQYQYQRDSQHVIDDASGSSNPKGNIYKKAQDVCAPKFTHYSTAYLQCTVDYLSQFTPAGKPTDKVNLPKADAYRYNYISPLWSPDFAGFSVLACLIVILLIVLRWLSLLVLRLMLKMSNR